MEKTGRFQLRNRSSSSSSSSSSSFTVNRESIRSWTNKSFSNPSTASQSSSFSHGTQNSSKSGRSSSTHLKQQVEENANRFSDIPNIVGTCPFMCPEAERAQRERLRDLAVFERLNRNPSLSSPSLAVKKFCRTITTKQVKPSDVRPLPVLDDTLNYLLNLMDCKEHPFEVVHDFIFDRTRSIRQDLSMQNIVNDKAVQMYEEMVKFHIISHRRLRNCSSPNTSSLHYLNTEQLMKTLISLFNLYEANRNSNLTYKNEAEFHSFYVLLHLGSNNQLLRESLSLWFRHVPFPIMSSKEMCFARNILRYFRMGNYKRFLSVIETEASYLHYCIIEPYINEVRALAFSCINNCGYKLHPYPLAHLSKLLMMKESDVESFCNACGLEVCSDEEGNKLLPTKQSTFCCPKGGFQCYSFCGLEKFET